MEVLVKSPGVGEIGRFVVVESTGIYITYHCEGEGEGDW